MNTESTDKTDVDSYEKLLESHSKNGDVRKFCEWGGLAGPVCSDLDEFYYPEQDPKRDRLFVAILLLACATVLLATVVMALVKA